MAHLKAKTEKTAHVVMGYTDYEESCVIAVALTREAAEAYVDKYEADHPRNWFDHIGVDTVDLV